MPYLLVSSGVAFHVYRQSGEAYAIIRSAKQGAVAGDRDARDRDVLLGNQLVGAVVLSKVPDTDAALAIATDDFALVRMDHDVVGGTAVVVGALDLATACLPNLDGAILGAGHHPLAFAVEGDAGDIASVALEGKQRIRVRRLDIVEFDRVVACGGEEALVGRDAEAIDL